MRFFRAFLVLAAVCLCASAASLVSQTRVLRDVTFTGAAAYSQAELLAFTGLKPGSSATQQQLEEAAQHLTDTGLFEEANFAGNDQGVVYTLKPAPANAVLSVRFSNFPWWQDEEIERTLKQRVALYHGGTVPMSGNLRESIASVLRAMLADKGVAGAQVASRLSSEGIGHGLGQVVFAIDAPAVLVRSLTLADGSPGMQPKLERIAQDIAEQPWDAQATYANVAARVSDVYHNVGYLDVAVTKAEHSAPEVTASGIELDVTAALSEGAQYHVTQLIWPGSEFLSTADFVKAATLKPGDPDSPLALRLSLKSLDDAYGAKGYIDARILAPPTIDRAAHTVAYNISVVPGPQYRLKAVHWPSVSAAQAKEFDSEWKMKPGDLFDSTYLLKFLTQNKTLAAQGYRMNALIKRDPKTLTVDLTITFAKTGAPQP